MNELVGEGLGAWAKDEGRDELGGGVEREP
jgi:hypothetical protein